ncbi:hypothetical protein QBC41DRAFT_331259 [Cercophora samala]|uniref:Secreted protein n=1 Tax=Cercophora samala TaxID=330535 RepID=A0AA40D1Z9_9PEZI|nr:hypothetical protein QBC41DRAFT_331259 [Cercophora samala]
MRALSAADLAVWVVVGCFPGAGVAYSETPAGGAPMGRFVFCDACWQWCCTWRVAVDWNEIVSCCFWVWGGATRFVTG